MSKSPHVLMLFLDGVGIGTTDPKRNPFFATRMEAFNNLVAGDMIHGRDSNRSTSTMSLIPLNTTLRVPGLPQSGTGQAALLTGINAPRSIGRHFGPYLYSSLKPIVAEQNIFNKLHMRGKKIFYANAFPQQYFDYLDSKKSRVPAIAFSWMSTGNRLNDAAKLSSGKALSADMTNERWDKLGYPDVPVITERAAGKRLVELARDFDFVLYEYYLTDYAGHSQSMKEAIEVLQKLDDLFEGILETLEYDTMTLVVTSDHGNLEDLSTKTHTRNPVPLLAVGQYHREITSRAKNLTHVAPAILTILQ